MADDSMDVVLPFEFSASGKPHSMTDYDLEALSEKQQKMLNKLKIEKKREDEIYLAKHPEVRALVALLTRSILSSRPRCIHTHAATFFRRSDLDTEVSRYLEANPPEPEYVPPTPEEGDEQVRSDVDKSFSEYREGAEDDAKRSALPFISEYMDEIIGKVPSTSSVSTIQFMQDLITSTFMTPSVERQSQTSEDSSLFKFGQTHASLRPEDTEKLSDDYESVQDVTHRIERDSFFKMHDKDDEYDDSDDDDDYHDDDDDDGDDDDEDDRDHGHVDAAAADDDDDDDDYDYDYDRDAHKEIVHEEESDKKEDKIEIDSLEEEVDTIHWTDPVAPSARKRRTAKTDD